MTLPRALTTLLLLTSLPLAGKTEPGYPLPVWQELNFEQHALWATAKSRLIVHPSGNESEQWLLQANSSVAGNSEEISLLLQASNGGALERSRLSEGKSRRLKSYRYEQEHVIRERREPKGGNNLPASEWPLSSRREIAYPDNPQALAVTDTYALLPLAERFLHSGETATEIIVHTDRNFYRVSFSHGGEVTVPADYELVGEGKVTGERKARAVLLTVKPVGTPDDKADFRLMGLYDNISIMFDTQNNLPLSMQGTTPRIGETSIQLKSATLREPPQ